MFQEGVLDYLSVNSWERRSFIQHRHEAVIDIEYRTGADVLEASLSETLMGHVGPPRCMPVGRPTACPQDGYAFRRETGLRLAAQPDRHKSFGDLSVLMVGTVMSLCTRYHHISRIAGFVSTPRLAKLLPHIGVVCGVVGWLAPNCRAATDFPPSF